MEVLFILGSIGFLLTIASVWETHKYIDRKLDDIYDLLNKLKMSRDNNNYLSDEEIKKIEMEFSKKK